ncbi:MAG: hypothetical protein RMJ56_00265 [Gemmataceae bacterium]|nr:hypothetical protein [Gemmataceae bacterium]
MANVLADGMADHVVVAERSQLRLELLLLAVGWEDAGFGQAAVGQRLLLVVEQQGEEG